jgi:hypothetical protein
MISPAVFFRSYIMPQNRAIMIHRRAPALMPTASLPHAVRIVRLAKPTPALESLPPADTKRWVMRRKAQVVAAVQSGLLTSEDACARYMISEEEFRSWQRLMDGHGVRALRATRLKEYRPLAAAPMQAAE